MFQRTKNLLKRVKSVSFRHCYRKIYFFLATQRGLMRVTSSATKSLQKPLFLRTADSSVYKFVTSYTRIMNQIKQDDVPQQ